MTAQANTKAKNFGKYLRGVRSELRKVIWPNKIELKNYTILVIVSCLLATMLLWVLDTIFGFGLNFIIG